MVGFPARWDENGRNTFKCCMFVLDLYIMYDVYTWLVGDMEQVPRRVNGLSYPLSIFGDSGFSLECRFHWLKLIEETHSVALGLSCSLC